MMRLLCMRLDEMLRVHPQQISDKCSQCSATVGVYPSGQRALKEHHGNIEIVCNHCQGSGPRVPAPGALDEPFQSKWRDEI